MATLRSRLADARRWGRSGGRIRAKAEPERDESGKGATVLSEHPPTAAPPAGGEPRDDAATLAAMGALAYILGDLLHEAAGHGLVCVATGGRAEMLTTVNFQCSENGRWMVAAGVLANLSAGLLLAAVLRWGRVASVRWRTFLWLAMVSNLFNVGGYPVYSGILNSGDLAFVIRGLEPAWLWRAGMALLGALLYWLFLRLAVALLPLAAGAPLAPRRAWRLSFIPYLAAGAAACLGGLFNPVGLVLVVTAAGASSFGSGLGLLAVAGQVEAPPQPGWTYPPPLAVGRQPWWLIAGVMVLAAFVAVLGPGLKLSS